MALGSEISDNVIELLEYIVVFYGISIFIFDDILIGKTNKTSIICVVVGIINALLPMEAINEYIFGSLANFAKDENFNFETVERTEGFATDYDRVNPATKEHASRKYQKLMRKDNEK